jgi:hypothetical protein
MYCRKFAPTVRNYSVARLMVELGLRMNETRSLDFADMKWELCRFGKVDVRKGKGAEDPGIRERMVPLINDSGARCGGSSRMWGHFRRRPHPAWRCSRPSVATLMAPRPGWVMRRCGSRWP